MKKFNALLSCTLLSTYLFSACGTKSSTTTQTGATVVDLGTGTTTNGDGVVNLGGNNTPSVVTDTLDSLLIGIKDLNKHNTHKNFWGHTVTEDETSTYEFELQVSTLGVNGTSPLADINDVLFVSVYRKDSADNIHSVLNNTNKIPMTSGQGKITIQAQFPGDDKWKNGQALYIDVFRPDPDATDDENGARSAQYIAYLEKNSISIF